MDQYYSDDQDGTGVCLVLLYMQILDFIQGYWPKSCLEKKSKDAVICHFGHVMFMYQLTIALSLRMNGTHGCRGMNKTVHQELCKQHCKC